MCGLNIDNFFLGRKPHSSYPLICWCRTTCTEMVVYFDKAGFVEDRPEKERCGIGFFNKLK